MKSVKLILAVTGILVGTTALHAQTLYDANRLMGSDLNGTARFVGMGGAMGALGGDISTMGTNPAGIGIYRSNDAMVSFGFGNFGSKSDYQGSKASVDKFQGSFDNVGFVFASKIGNQTALRFVNFGFNYHKVKSFSKNMLMSGALSSSQTQQFAAMSNRPGNPNYMGEIIENSVYQDPAVYTYDDVSWLGAMAYKANLINPYYQIDPVTKQPIQQKNEQGQPMVDKDGNPLYLETYEPYLGAHDVNSKYNGKESGGLHAYDFNVAFNINDRFYLGATLGVYSVGYNRTNSYSETFLPIRGSSEADKKGDYTLNSSYSADGSGVDFKLGFILRPFADSPLRIGAAIHTPTFYKITERNSASLDYNTYNIATSRFDNSTVSPHGENGGELVNETSYQLSTPWKYNLSLGYTIGKFAAIGAEYEYIDYSAAKLQYDDGVNMEYENAEIKNMLKGVHTIRLGAEFKLSPAFAFRLGYNYITAPMQNDAFRALANNSTQTDTQYSNIKATNNYTLGLGYRGTTFYADVAYQLNSYEEDFYAFDNVNLAATTVSNTNNRVVFTLGMRF